jgi:hypothetical protein
MEEQMHKQKPYDCIHADATSALCKEQPTNILPRQNTILAKWHVMTTIICLSH